LSSSKTSSPNSSSSIAGLALFFAAEVLVVDFFAAGLDFEPPLVLLTSTVAYCSEVATSNTRTFGLVVTVSPSLLTYSSPVIRLPTTTTRSPTERLSSMLSARYSHASQTWRVLGESSRYSPFSSFFGWFTITPNSITDLLSLPTTRFSLIKPTLPVISTL